MREDLFAVRALQRRLERVERRCRRLQFGLLGGVLLLASAGIVWGQRAPAQQPPILPEIGIEPRLIDSLQDVPQVEERVIAREFMLVDSDDNHRASLVADNAGSVFLTLLDPDSNLRAALSVMNRGPALTFYDPDGTVRAVLGSTTLVASHVEDAAGNVERETPSSIVLFDGEGDLLWREP